MLDKFNLLKPDILITDISMPVLSGTDAVKKLKVVYPESKVLFLSMLYSEQYVYYTLKIGGNGLIDKNIVKGELLYAIKTIYHGKNYFGPLYDEAKLKELITKYEFRNPHTKDKPHDDLTVTEEKILFFISQCFSSAEIAEKLCVSKRTVDYHRMAIMNKLKLPSFPALVRYAVVYSEGRKI
jgi:DNA-binding NarL/FixJ family response regulator